jgi:hypothetical protein
VACVERMKGMGGGGVDLDLWVKQREAQNRAPGNKKWGRIGSGGFGGMF